MKRMIYAAYQGETPLIVDTAENVAKYLDIKVSSVRWLSNPSAQKRDTTGNRLHIIKFEEVTSEE